jgi:hypothetical protein
MPTKPKRQVNRRKIKTSKQDIDTHLKLISEEAKKIQERLESKYKPVMEKIDKELEQITTQIKKLGKSYDSKGVHKNLAKAYDELFKQKANLLKEILLSEAGKMAEEYRANLKLRKFIITYESLKKNKSKE